jgi:UDP-N-acetylmuramate dehydrogenase
MVGVENSFKHNIPLAQYTTYRIGGPADLFAETHSTEELVTLVTYGRHLGIPVFVFGGGTNILVSDKGIRGLVIKNNSRRIRIRTIHGTGCKGIYSSRIFVEADSGVPFNMLVRHTIEDGLAGLETHLGLPGSVGGAVYMNSKWMHPMSFVGDVVHQAVILTSEGRTRTVPKTFFQFGYDASILQKTHDIVLAVVFMLAKGNMRKLWDIADKTISYRRETQPHGIQTAGCVFKNIPLATITALGLPHEFTSAGLILDKAGLKGIKIGDAQFSPVHANFIVNLKNARASDVIKLMDSARKQVKQKFGIELEEEIVRVGDYS